MATIAEKLTKLADTKKSIKDAIVAKGVAVADTDPFSAYPAKIGEIQAGGGAPATKLGVSIDNLIGDVDENGRYTAPAEGFVFDGRGIKSIGSSAFRYSFYENSLITEVLFPDLEEIETNGLDYAFYNSSVARVSLGKVRVVNQNFALRNCFAYLNTKLAELPLNNIEELSGLSVAYAAFSSSFGGTATGLYNLRIIHGDSACGYMLSNASSLTDIQLDSLESISGSSACSSMFATNSALEKAYFYSLTEVLTAGALGTSSSTCMFYNCTAMTELHFRADAQAVIEGLTAYQYKFGATNATIYFDLIGTITVDGVEYARDEKQSIRVDGVKTFVGWKDANDNIVYTSCTDNAEPAVDTVVYSDQGATQVGTVEAVA